MKRILASLVLAASACMPALYAQERISHGSFDDVAFYRPKSQAKQFVLFLSGDQGWTRDMDATARALQDEGAMVAGIDLRRLRGKFAKGDDACVLPDGDLENLSHYLQGYAGQPTYRTPLLVGYQSGAALAYAMQAVADSDVFSGALSLAFRPSLDLGKPLCPREGKAFTRSSQRLPTQLLPVTALTRPWVVLQPADDAEYNAAQARQFLKGMRGAALSTLPAASPNTAYAATLPALLASYRSLAKRQGTALPPPPATLAGLPLIELQAKGQGDTFAVLLSGDGGWAGLDKEVADALVAKGIPVVGFDSLRYFWKPRKPAELATDLDRIVGHYAQQWKRPRVILVGYSQGADVLPFAVNRLPAPTRAKVAQTVLMGLGDNASFEFHLANWIGRDDGLPILPEVKQLHAADTLCLYGVDDSDSICPKIPPGHVLAQPLAGGHHFDGAYDKLAALILQRTRQP